MNENMKPYYDYTISPLGKLFYRTVWKQLEHIKNKKILDFGSGFAFTANFLAKHNEVTAIELDQSMIEHSENTNNFEQIHGDLTSLKAMPDASFDVIICHLVFEFVDIQEEILAELIRVLKHDGLMSIVRHNRWGRIIQAIVQDANPSEARKLLEGAPSHSSAFGDIKYYEDSDLLNWAKQKLSIESIHGVRALASLHDGETQAQKGWLDDMFEIEDKILMHPEIVKIAYFNHLILRKLST